MFNVEKRDLVKQLKEVLPGPGQYDWKVGTVKKIRNGFSFGRHGLKGPRLENNFVGPGHYNPKYFQKLKHGVIGRKERVLGDRKQSTPGYYAIPSCIPHIAKYNYPAWEHRKIRI